MADWLNTLFDLAAQFTGGREPAGPNLVGHAIVAIGWATLLAVSSSPQRRRVASHESLLRWAFLLGLLSELWMIEVKVGVALGWFTPAATQALLFPEQSAMHDLVGLLVAGGLICLATASATHAKRFLVICFALIAIGYAMAFFWWSSYGREHLGLRFGQTGPAALIQGGMALCLTYATLAVWSRSSGRTRYATCAGIACFWLFTVLKLPELTAGPVYEAIYEPIRSGLYLLAVVLVGNAYIGGIVVQTRRELLRGGEREQQTRDIFDSMFQFIGVLQLDGTLTDINQTALNFASAKSEDVIGKPFWECAWWTGSAETQELLRRAIQRAAAGEFVRSAVDVSDPAKDRTTLDLSIKPLRNQRGEVVLLIPSGRDITEQRRAEEELRIRDQAIATAVTPIAIGDLDGRMNDANQAFIQLWGYDHLDEIVGRSSVELFALEQDGRGILEGLRANGHWQGEYSAIRKNGERFPVEVSAFVVTDAAGAPVRTMASFVDVTDRNQARDQLVREKALFEAIVRGVPDALMLASLDRIITYCNPGVSRVFGYDPAELVGQPASVLYANHEEYERQGGLRFRSDAGEHYKPFEVQWRRKDGVPFPGESVGTIIRQQDGEPLGFLGLIRDVSDRRDLEKQVLDISGDEQRRIGQDLHDGVGQELTGLGMLADTLVTALSRKSSPEQQIAAKLAVGIKRTLGQVRALARGMNPVNVGAEGLMSALTEMSHRMRETCGVNCTFQCEQAVLFRDKQTASQLYRIAQEATTNAVKHGKATQITISLTTPGQTVVLKVADDGVGIEKRVSSTSGMGIRIMAYRAGAVGAQLDLSPLPGGGTELVCTLPSRSLVNPAENVP